MLGLADRADYPVLTFPGRAVCGPGAFTEGVNEFGPMGLSVVVAGPLSGCLGPADLLVHPANNVAAIAAPQTAKPMRRNPKLDVVMNNPTLCPTTCRTSISTLRACFTLSRQDCVNTDTDGGPEANRQQPAS